MKVAAFVSSMVALVMGAAALTLSIIAVSKTAR
ncbi:Uncharacterised protein [Acetobacterium wieringae]|jgi:hypothetical protein|uniref:Uncharacterized protein n=1 Tax=Acetobacterium wieringae TaxID=52694 RepID=A0A1F2PGC7_9FIRM|nr:hypothetical protein ACWI_21710 [Acetobacterium wieringae]VUZ25154.1 Uncharacterised protein [Acetobacterium wieringae]